MVMQTIITNILTLTMLLLSRRLALACELGIEVSCASDGCLSTEQRDVGPLCSNRMNQMTLFYSGGTCEQSLNFQYNTFSCEDLNGGPPATFHKTSFIHVTNVEGDTIYHSDWVRVGSSFTVKDNRGNAIAESLMMTILSSDDIVDSSAVFQSLQFHTTCAIPIFMNDQFGAVEVTGWVTEEASIDGTTSESLEVAIIPLDGSNAIGEAMSMSLMVVGEDVAPADFNLINYLDDPIVADGASLTTTISVPFDMSLDTSSFALHAFVSLMTESGEACTGSLQFTVEV